MDVSLDTKRIVLKQKLLFNEQELLYFNTVCKTKSELIKISHLTLLKHDQIRVSCDQFTRSTINFGGIIMILHTLILLNLLCLFRMQTLSSMTRR